MSQIVKSKKNKKKAEMPSEYYQVLKNVGSFMEYWGFKAVHGKIWACIFLAKDPVDANFIISQLQLSKAAISLGIKDLLYYNVILEVEKEGPSTQKYVSNPDLVDVICNVLRQREKKMLQTIVGFSKSLSEKTTSSESGLDAQRVQQLKKMSEQAHTILDQILQMQLVSLKEMSTLLGMENV
jgi:DNA-binding transcriptional regulator GbsR (MarR family)